MSPSNEHINQMPPQQTKQCPNCGQYLGYPVAVCWKCGHRQ